MFCINIVFLYFLEFRLPCQFSAVVLAVYCTLLQSGEQFCEGHGCRVSAICFPLCQLQFVFHDTDFQTFQVIHGFDGFVCGRECTERVFLPLKQLETDFVQLFTQVVTQFAVQHFIYLLFIFENPGNIQTVNIITESSYCCVCCQYDVIVTKLTAFQQFTFTAQYVICINIYGHSTIGFLLQTHLKEFRRVDGSRGIPQRIDQMFAVFLQFHA